LNKSVDDAQTRMDGLTEQIKGSNLVTHDGLYSDVQLGINTGDIVLNMNDVILDPKIEEKIDAMSKALDSDSGDDSNGGK
jgi:hypothetical protein